MLLDIRNNFFNRIRILNYREHRNFLFIVEVLDDVNLVLLLPTARAHRKEVSVLHVEIGDAPALSFPQLILYNSLLIDHLFIIYIIQIIEHLLQIGVSVGAMQMLFGF